MKSPIDNFLPKSFPHGSITQFFGENPDLYNRFGLKAHNGIDIVNDWDSPVYAVESGEIIDTKRSPDGYGRQVRILSGGNQWTYGHLEQILVKVGQQVKAGDKIGTMGNTGFVVSDQTTKSFWGEAPRQSHPGTHLHLGLRKVVKDKNGFAYPGSKTKIRVLNYDNGYKGSIDPLPVLAPNIQNLEKQITLLQKVVELLTLMKKK